MSEVNKGKVILGMSGGVDSSVAALLLKRQGYQVIGVFMKNWEEEENGVCCANTDYEDVTKVCKQIGIPHYTLNFSKQYWERVFAHCLKEFKDGYTPNPDILCNREIKFNLFFEKAMELNADYLATGHYCRNLFVEGERRLAKGKDPNKDQSYFLYAINKRVLDRVLFPLGDLKKEEVREIANRHQLATAKKKDSTGICFIGKRNFKDFLSKYIPIHPGNIETLGGKIVGRHDGIAYYTIGQRKGLGIGGQGEAWFVVGKDVARNALIVDQGVGSQELYSKSLIATELSWLGELSLSLPFRCKAKIRYRQNDEICTIIQMENKEIHVEFDSLQKAVAPRQSIVFYDGEICLGGAIIRKSFS